MNLPFPRRGLYVLTDPRLLPGDRLISSVEQALRGGARVVQYRDKDASADERIIRARQLAELCHDYQVPLIINDDVPLAKSSGADGVHLGQSDMQIAEARKVLGEQAIIGATCHGELEFAREALDAGASYLAFGRFFASRTKPEAIPARLSILRQARQLSSLPIVAIGGINLDNAPQVLDAGADCLAVIDSVFGAADIRLRASQFSQLFRTF